MINVGGYSDSFEAKKRYGISILNYAVTSNHIHLVMMGGKAIDAIPQTMQLVAGRVGQEYNQRKDRKVGLLGGSLSRNGSRNEFPFEPMHGLC